MRLIALLIISLLIVAGCKSDQVTSVSNNSLSDPLIDSSAKVFVGRVIDGDTFVIGIGRDSFSVRILGIDAYEIKHDAHLDSQAVKSNISIDSAYTLGIEGERFADSLISKQYVLLVRDYKQPDFDVYNRLLRYVYYYQGTATLDYGALMLQKKLALVDTP